MIDVLLLLGSLALIVACGGFVAAEFSLVTIDRATVERAAEDGDKQAEGVLSALTSLSTQLSGAQLGITITNLLIGFLAEPTVADLIEGPLESAGVPSGAVTAVAFVLAITVATSVTMVIGELVPKNLAIARPLQTARAVQGFMRGFTRAAGPLIDLFNRAANRILRRLGVEPQEELATARSPYELASLIGRSADQGTLGQDTATLLQRSLKLSERRADDVMTPRTRMRTIGPEASVLAVIELARASGLSRFPVAAATREEIMGIVHVKHAVAVAREQRETTAVKTVMVDPIVVPSTMALDPLLSTLRGGGLQMAVVIDEFGGIDGIVTLEDVVEEIVGDVVDEHDRRDPAIRKDPRGGWALSGLLRPDEVGAAVDLHLPESDDYETVGGLINTELGRFAQVGDVVELTATDAHQRARPVTLTVLRMDGLRVDRVRLTVRDHRGQESS